MEFDPLSRITRRARNGLVIVAISILLAHAFNVQITNLEGVGVDVTMSPKLIYSLATILLIYFLISFLHYIIEDAANKDTPFFEYWSKQRSKHNNLLYSISSSWFIDILYQKFDITDRSNGQADMPLAVEQTINKEIRKILKGHDEAWIDSQDNRDSLTRKIIDILDKKLKICSHDEISWAAESFTNRMFHIIREHRQGDLIKITYKWIKRSRLWIIDIGIPIMLSILALWINIGIYGSDKILNYIFLLLNSLASPPFVENLDRTSMVFTVVGYH